MLGAGARTHPVTALPPYPSCRCLGMDSGASYRCHNLRTFAPRPLGVLAEVVRVLKRGGVFSALPRVIEAEWEQEITYFPFLPDFLPPQILALLRGLESRLERSPYRYLSVHYLARLRKK